MKKGLLVIEANGPTYATLNKQLTELHYSKERIQRSFSIDESLAHPKDAFFIIIVDVSSPAASIPSSLQALQKHFKNIPVIVLSDKDDKEDAVIAIREGAQDFLVNGKYDTAQLEKAILFAAERKTLTVKTEFAVREYKRHFENGPIPMWIIDSATMKFLIVNNAAVEKYGYSKEEFRRMTIYDILPPDEKELAPELESLKKKDFYDAGYRKFLAKKGESFYTHIYTHATQFGNVDATINFAIDVNKNIQVEKQNEELTSQIKAQKEQLESLLYAMGYTIWSRKANTFELVYAYPNNAYLKVFGYTADEMMKNKGLFYNAVHPYDIELVYESLKEANTKGASEVIFRYLCPSGEIRP